MALSGPVAEEEEPEDAIAVLTVASSVSIASTAVCSAATPPILSSIDSNAVLYWYIPSGRPR
jgi:hypothetical protein